MRTVWCDDEVYEILKNVRGEISKVVKNAKDASFNNAMRQKLGLLLKIRKSRRKRT